MSKTVYKREICQGVTSPKGRSKVCFFSVTLHVIFVIVLLWPSIKFRDPACSSRPFSTCINNWSRVRSVQSVSHQAEHNLLWQYEDVRARSVYSCDCLSMSVDRCCTSLECHSVSRQMVSGIVCKNCSYQLLDICWLIHDYCSLIPGIRSQAKVQLFIISFCSRLKLDLFFWGFFIAISCTQHMHMHIKISTHCNEFICSIYNHFLFKYSITNYNYIFFIVRRLIFSFFVLVSVLENNAKLSSLCNMYYVISCGLKKSKWNLTRDRGRVTRKEIHWHFVMLMSHLSCSFIMFIHHVHSSCSFIMFIHHVHLSCSFIMFICSYLFEECHLWFFVVLLKLLYFTFRCTQTRLLCWHSREMEYALLLIVSSVDTNPCGPKWTHL
jgi:hypothetical protein